MKLFKFITPFLVLVFLTLNLFAAEISKEVSVAMKAGNSKELAKFFNTNIELSILEKEGVYSKTQAELIIKNFFTKHAPTSFVIIHDGGEGVKYAIGNLKTSNGTYRVTIMYKEANSKTHIHQLRIEEDD